MFGFNKKNKNTAVDPKQELDALADLTAGLISQTTDMLKQSR